MSVQESSTPPSKTLVKSVLADQVDEIRELARNHTGKEIAARFGASVYTVRKFCSREGISIGSERRQKGVECKFIVTRKAREVIEAEAKARGIQPGLLCRRLIEAIVKDNMFSAVLDDGR